MLPITLVIFDCDGVLIDSEPLASRTLAETLNRAGVAITPAEAHRQFTGNAESDIRRICADEFGIADVPGLFAEWHHALYRAFSTELLPMADMVDLVTRLDQPKCVASNSSAERLRNSLGRTALWPLFAPHVFSAESVEKPKPAPDLLLHCAAQFGTAPEQCLMIDDSPHGVTAAVAAGMRVIGFVDPRDPRPNRFEALMDAGADAVAIGTAELRQAFDHRLTRVTVSEHA